MRSGPLASNPLRWVVQRVSTNLYRPDRDLRGFSWVPDFPRMAIGALPVGSEADQLPDHGFTHVINCRRSFQNTISQDLWIEREIFGPDRVVHADMWDNGRAQDPRRWTRAAAFGARVLSEDPEARLLVHCQQGRRRSLFVAYAILRQHGFSQDDAAAAVLEARPFGHLVPVYRAGVEEWLALSAAGASTELPPVAEPDAIP